ncbi:uncharacterized protein LOC133525210 [Cydia pomonella]|uniref:uncharacterized protein LOC133525210 n=1 Tax=Cydia pomonella TaxID=82600 RepID=UPI002ADE5312|nr:uncharacterized protein LOC133525210 [Cydia pomonella]
MLYEIIIILCVLYLQRFSVTSQELGLNRKQKITNTLCEKNTSDKDSVIIFDEGALSNGFTELNTSQQDDRQFPSTSGIQNNITNNDFDSDDSVADVTWKPPTKTAYVADSDDDDADNETANDNETELVNNSLTLREIVNKTTQSKPRSSKKITRSKKRDNKTCRYTGQAYHSYGKDRPARQMKELSICRYNCRRKISEHHLPGPK